MIRRLRALGLRITGLLFQTRAERDFREELESHLRMHIDENVRSGMDPQEARRVALLKLGGVAPTQEAYRDQRGLPFIDAAWQDFRRAFRFLLKKPTLIAVTTVSIGIGAGVNLG